MCWCLSRAVQYPCASLFREIDENHSLTPYHEEQSPKVDQCPTPCHEKEEVPCLMPLTCGG